MKHTIDTNGGRRITLEWDTEWNAEEILVTVNYIDSTQINVMFYVNPVDLVGAAVALILEKNDNVAE